MKTLHLVALLLSPISLSATAPAQTVATHTLDVNLRYSATRAQTLAGTCCFYLQGGAADVALPVLPRLAAVLEVGGGTTARVATTSRGVSTVTLFAGPRYSVPAGRRLLLSGQALLGAARGFDADFTTATHTQDTATAFGMALGGFAEYRVTRALRLRPVQVDYLQTNLPNGADNRQRNVRLGAGVTVTVPLPQSRR